MSDLFDTPEFAWIDGERGRMGFASLSVGELDARTAEAGDYARLAVGWSEERGLMFRVLGPSYATWGAGQDGEWHQTTAADLRERFPHAGVATPEGA